MSVAELTTSAQNYLKVVWAGSEWSDAPITATYISEQTGLRLSTVSDAVRKLADQGLVSHTRYGSVELTTKGREYALSMIRRHRLIETFLVRTLGYRWDEVHDEAEHLEHAVSNLMVDRIDEFLGFPTRDPHGDPIPGADGSLEIPDATQLTLVPFGSQVTVERISDHDPEFLQFLEEHDITVGASLRVEEGAPYSESLDVVIEGSNRTVSLGRAAAAALYTSVRE